MHYTLFTLIWSLQSINTELTVYLQVQAAYPRILEDPQRQHVPYGELTPFWITNPI
jgi:hypothetical protein